MRLFIAVDIPLLIKKKIEEIVFQLKQELTDLPIKWVSSENIHITLKFIGEVLEDEFNQINNSLKKIHFNSFQLKVNEGAFLPQKGKPRILFLDLTGNELKKLVLEIENKLKEIGISKEKREFKAHITIARIKNKINKSEIKLFIEKTKNFNEVFSVSEFALYKSALQRTAPIYTKKQIYSLE